MGHNVLIVDQVWEYIAYIRSVFLVIQDETTRRNLGIAYVISGVFYMKSENFDLAGPMFERAEDSGVVLPDFVNEYGVCLVFQGRLNEAKRAFERVLEMEPQNEVARSNLARLNLIEQQSTD